MFDDRIREMYSQTWVERPPFGPQKSGRCLKGGLCSEVVINTGLTVHFFGVFFKFWFLLMKLKKQKLFSIWIKLSECLKLVYEWKFSGYRLKITNLGA
jgi:hypothetical protein